MANLSMPTLYQIFQRGQDKNNILGYRGRRLNCGNIMAKKRKKTKYRHVVINKKRYYFYKISWVDITADGGHATAEEFDKFECSKMITFAYVYKKTKKFVWTFSSYDTKDEVFSDRNVMPIGCVLKLEKRDA